MITEIYVAFNTVKFGVDGDVIDRLHHKYTVYLLLFLALFLTTETMVGTKIKCFVKIENPDSWNTYLDKYCWVKNTYYVDPDIVDIEAAVAEGNYNEITYYQWAAIILALAAVMFYLPCKLWHAFGEKAGIDFNHMITTCCNFNSIGDESKRQATYKNLAKYVDRFLDNQDNGAAGAKRPLFKTLQVWSPQSGNYLGFGYIVTKFVYLLNVTAQFVFLTVFLGDKTSFWDFGLSVSNFVSQGMVWEDQSRFPRITYCNWTRDDLGVKVSRIIQCLLPQNIYMEKVFIIVWWWYLMLFVVTVLNVVAWTTRIYGAFDKVGYVRKYLQSVDRFPTGRPSAHKKQMLGNFVHSYLKQDGVFVLRLVAKNVSSLMISQIVAEIWDHFVTNYADEMRSRGVDPDEFPDDDTVPLAPDSEDEEVPHSNDSLDDYNEDDLDDYSRQMTADKQPRDQPTEE
jgi:hypothetical protein